MSENELLKLSVRNNALSKVRNYESEGELPLKASNDINSISPILQRSPTLDHDEGKVFNSVQQSQDDLFKHLGLKSIKELSDEEFAKKITNLTSSSFDDVHSEIPEIGDHEFEASVTQLAKLLTEADIDPKKSLNDSELRLMSSMSKIGFSKRPTYSPTRSVRDFKSYLENHSKPDITSNDTVLGPVWDSVAPSIKSRMQRSISAFREHLTLEEDAEQTVNVLNKINSEIQAVPPKREPFTDEKWAELAQRLNRPYEKKAKKIEKIRSEREEEYSKQNTFQPSINERSRLLVSNSSLDERVNTFLQEKQKNIEKKKEEVSKLMGNELKFKPEITKKSQKLNRDVNLLLHWSEERKQKLESLKTAVDQEHLEPCTFKPALSTRSRKIAEKSIKKQGTNTSFQQSTDVFERNYEWEFIKNHKKRKFIESFIKMEKALHNPNITIKASNLKRDGPFGERLYKQGLEFLEKKEKTRENLLSALYQKRSAGCIQQKEDDPYFGDAEDRVDSSATHLTEEQINELIKLYAIDADEDAQVSEGRVQDQDKHEENTVSTPPDHEEDESKLAEDHMLADPKEKYAKTMETLRLFRQSQLSQKTALLESNE
ncbi:hypothetical protein C9374_006695 [Naegleria lovaniensis]|uniref:Uncharacterized protein n=1 Tax=Naegleria lovaniensis TaxID=51637 RepID=A0AA88GJ85_NAELO|nr:uncharacterized protein C9374_006695 [Naegleria lovaniensis]KAG2379578.1 hypothetical protein C9374_006695 [Naegleria lovaniensis]